jgi:hypothetical protein
VKVGIQIMGEGVLAEQFKSLKRSERFAVTLGFIHDDGLLSRSTTRRCVNSLLLLKKGFFLYIQVDILNLKRDMDAKCNISGT